MDGGKVVEGELLGAPRRPALAPRLAAAAAFAVLGLAVGGAGLLLTVTVIGAPLGVPLLAAGALLLLGAFAALLGSGRVVVLHPLHGRTDEDRHHGRPREKQSDQPSGQLE